MFKTWKLYLMMSAAILLGSTIFFGVKHIGDINQQLATVTAERNALTASYTGLVKQQDRIRAQVTNLQNQTSEIDLRRAKLEEKLNELRIADNFARWAEADINKLRDSMRIATRKRLRAVISAANDAGGDAGTVSATTNAPASDRSDSVADSG